MDSGKSFLVTGGCVRPAALVLLAAFATFITASAPAVAASSKAELRAQLDQLEADVTRGEDVSAIKKLQRAYGYYLDKGLWADLADLFAEDAVANYPAGIFVGYPSIREHLFKNVGGAGVLGLGEGRLYNHMILQPVVHLDAGGQSAKGRWRAFAMMGRHGRAANWAEGIYEITYVKDQGVWKIKTLDYHSGFGASYEGGWTKARGTEASPPANQPGAQAPAQAPAATSSAAAPQPSRRFALAHAPDRPRNEACSGYPAACIAPFHYANLGSGGAGAVWPAEPAAKKKGKANVRVQLADVVRRAALLQDEVDVANLQRIYGYYLDRRLWDQVADLFADDGTLELDQRGVYVGKARVRQFLQTFGPQGLSEGQLNDHMQLQPIVDVAPNGRMAWARSRELAMTGNYPGSGAWSEGTYENVYVKQDGIWKIQALHFYPTFITDYDKGWGKDAQPAPGIDAQLPPDRPPSVTYEIYPQQYVPAFHYPNPVTGKPPQYPQPAPANAALPMRNATTSKASASAKLRTLDDQSAALTAAQGKIQRVKDYHELENLQNAYGYYLDKNLWNDLADLFAQNGSMELAQRGVYVGRERVRSFLTTAFGAPGPRAGRLGNHVQLQPVIHVAPAGDTAQVRVRLFQQMGEMGGRGSWGGAVYENEAVKEDGVWKFKSVHAYNTFGAGYEGGWAKSPGRSTPPGPSKTNPPDKPPTLVFEMFPKVYAIPFHYRNPVSGRE